MNSSRNVVTKKIIRAISSDDAVTEVGVETTLATCTLHA